ncbi:RcnB family protein [Lysobacter auxotrophicus]|uniref:RcnB family protein n=1 Tax=Lysobacter auxotrophicus TaxID=2992573 RepID=A0ABN6UQX3_9GAMM|nr:RcnB family protein [Lysobacter auxotrophicus]BDU18255.1 RcnB family protein [Lysobacter auxotrophicus]
MKRLISTLAVGFLLLSPVVASAHGKGHGHGRGHDHHDRYDDHDDRHDRGRKNGHYKHDYRRGVVYVERRVYVDDYHHYDLREPPRGHRWVRSDDGRYVLIAVATGIIADVLLHH